MKHKSTVYTLDLKGHHPKFTVSVQQNDSKSFTDSVIDWLPSLWITSNRNTGSVRSQAITSYTKISDLKWSAKSHFTEITWCKLGAVNLPSIPKYFKLGIAVLDLTIQTAGSTNPILSEITEEDFALR